MTIGRALAATCVALPTLVMLAVAAPAAAACVAPSISISPTAGAADTTVTVVGRDWRAGCNDVITQPVGGTPSPQPPVPPDRATIIFTQNGQSQELGTVTANSDYTFTTRVRVPSSAVSGEASFTARGRSAGATAAISFQVTAGATAPGETLPRTGSLAEVSALALMGLGLVAAGGWLITAARPRGRHAAQAAPRAIRKCRSSWSVERRRLMLLPMAMRWRRLLLLTAAVATLAGCSGGEPPSAASPEERTARLEKVLSGGLDEASQVPASLRDTAWRLVSLQRRAESEKVHALDSTLAFKLDGVRGKTCNSYGASVDTAISDTIRTYGFFSTQMRCEGPAGEVDRLVQDVLDAGASWQRQGASMTLARGDVTLVFELQQM